MKNRQSPAMVIILTVVTCGLYGLYWYYRTSEDIQDAAGVRDVSPGMEVALILVTCGLYTIYWWYKYGTLLVDLERVRGVTVRDNTVLLTLLSAAAFWAGPFDLINMAIMQGDLNDLWGPGRQDYA
jgi:hypothetical protein